MTGAEEKTPLRRHRPERHPELLGACKEHQAAGWLFHGVLQFVHHRAVQWPRQMSVPHGVASRTLPEVRGEVYTRTLV